MADIFISYARSTARQARAVADALRREGYSVWNDDNLPTHRAYGEVIEEQLALAKAVVVIWSAEAVRSQWVRSEADRARGENKLVQLSVDGARLPMPFDQIQCADLSGPAMAHTHPNWAKVTASVADLMGAAAPAPSAPRRTSHAGGGGPLLAVLPFDNLSNDAEMEFFSDGVSEDIIQRLSRGAGLKVIGRTSSFQFRGGHKAEAAEALACTHVLDGSIRRAAGRVRVSAHLVDTRSRTTLWSDRFDRDIEDIFAVQDEISEQIAAALGHAFDLDAKAVDVGAYDLYLRATPQSDTPEEAQRCIALLELAVEKDPDFADAWARLADASAHHLLFEPYRGRPARAKVIRRHAERALKLDPEHPVALNALMSLEPPFGAFVEMESLAHRMMQARPVPQGIQGTGSAAVQFHLNVGRLREGLESAERWLKMDPLNRNAANGVGFYLCGVERYGEAAEIFDAIIADYDAAPFSWNALVTRAYMEDWEEFDRRMQPDWLAAHPLRELRGILPLLRVWRDPTPENLAALAQRVTTGSQAVGGIQPGTLAVTARAGLVDLAYELAERFPLGPQGNSRDIVGINAYRTELLFQAPYKALRDDPRFPTICARLGLVDYWMTSGAWPDCATEVPYDFKAACERAAAEVPKEPFWPS
ncbi:TIR domain-containing protein [Phenylobacterium sp.]|uniref:TIR domain-containing protein n=1 Tax=Phenylobacterium sp. TaxID=1871053 RepID=UPI002DED9919|nr:TIR domain-containing protein [Phenylobacterium sp.]